MSRHQHARLGVRALLAALLLTLIFAAGSAVGIYVSANGITVSEDVHAEDHESASAEKDDHEEEGAHVALTRQAHANLGLEMGPVTRGDFWKTTLVPAQVVEVPGHSELSVSAPVTGVIEKVQILAGQSLAQSTPLFIIRLTDEALIEAQSKLIELLARRNVIDQEIARLGPLQESGIVSGSKTRDLAYQLKQLQSEQSSVLQELRSRGLPQSMIETVLDEQVLASTMTVYPPDFANIEGPVSSSSSSGFSVESLMVHTGSSVTRGQTLCTVAYHSHLYVEGSAFQEDLPILDRIARESWQVRIEPHDRHPEAQHAMQLELLRIDNHVDEKTQTLKFYIDLPNEVVRTRESDGRRFEQWRFRPGQRLHIRLPVENWKDQIVLPIDAVVIDGPNAMVFRQHDEGTAADGQASLVRTSSDPRSTTPELSTLSEDDDGFIELEPQPVRLLYRDDKHAVVADDGSIALGEPIALNNAFKLYLAMQMQAGGGADHHHHDH